LAFAVAAHLDPEIMIVDEVLAVGDAAFQKKCLGKMGSVTGKGRTILFVSHNMAVIRSLCSRAILIHDGALAADGPAGETISTYLAMLEKSATTSLAERAMEARGRARLIGVEVSTGSPELAHVLMTGQPVRLGFRIEPVRRGTSCSFTILDP